MNLSVGERVRIVTMNGCMAHVRENPREGIVVKIFSKKKVYGDDFEKYKYVTIKLDDGTIIEKCAEPRLWNIHDGLPEYRE